MNWLPLAEKPKTAEPVTALIATKDEDGEYFLMGIYLWRDGRWVDEDGFKPLPAGDYWYVLEADLCADLKAKVAA